MTVHNGNSKNTCTAPTTKNLDFSKFSLNRFLWRWQLAQVKAIWVLKKVIIFRRKKICNTAKSIQWFTLLFTGLSLKAGPVHKMPSIFFSGVYLQQFLVGVCRLALQILTVDLFQTNTYQAIVRQYPSRIFCSQTECCQ